MTAAPALLVPCESPRHPEPSPRVALVRQRRRADCGVACLAMLAGVPYDVADAHVRATLPAHQWRAGLSRRLMDALLASYGLATLRRYGNVPLFADRHLVEVEWRGQRGWHYVVALRGGVVLDPLVAAPLDLGDGERWTPLDPPLGFYDRVRCVTGVFPVAGAAPLSLPTLDSSC